MAVTEIISCTENAIQKAADILKNGGVVAIPTETVYGLAADVYNIHAVESIFQIKGRPQDNPLIVHISDIDMLPDIVSVFSDTAKRIAEAFWPGPLTIIMPKSERISPVITAGLNTVAVRFPAHPDAQRIINAANTPLAAPSANLSGRPSPTTARHVYDDLNGRIGLILDGGECEVGLESTVISVEDDMVNVLRPGKITVEDLKTVVDQVYVDDAVINGVKKDTAVASPGMKYKHYAPKAQVTILDGDFQAFKSYVQAHADEGVYALVFEGEEDALSPLPALTMGRKQDSASQAKVLFERLRELDDLSAKIVFARMPVLEGVGLAVYNRLIRAAAFHVIKL